MKRILFGVATFAVAAFAGCQVETKASDVICVADQSNVCTDCPPPSDPEDKATYAGRHTCAHDGKSFGPCEQCVPTIVDSGFKERPREKTDGGTTLPPPTGPAIDASCKDKVGILAGRDDPNDMFTYAATFDGADFKVFSASGAPMRSPAAGASIGGNVVVVYRSKNDAMVTTTFSNGKWSPSIGIPGATTNGPPGLATWGTDIKAVFRQSDGYHHAATYTAGAWADGVDLVGSSTFPAPTGASEPSVVSTGAPGLSGAAIVVGYTDDAKGIYRQEWRGTSWFTKGIKSTTVAAKPSRPSLVAMTAGTYDLFSAYIVDDGVLHVSTRTSKDQGTAWSADGITHEKAKPMEAVNGIGIQGGRALVVYRDAEKHGQFMVFDPTKTPAWSEPAPLLGEQPVLTATPQLARDPCGAEAMVAIATADGPAVLRFTGKEWTGPFRIDGVPSVTYATIVTTQ